MPRGAVGLADIERIFEILDRLGISREAVVIPLRPVHPGGVRLLPNGKLEIQVESEVALGEWLPELERMIVALAHRG
ncbi:MAG TPA: hypothetical protein VKA21_08560 [Candidatus Binatia bacterium]|nr:hypothetical protein [Candidatus Binatia bacterium]